jgi:hypothetical protein
MNKSTIIGSVAGAVALIILGYVIWAMLFVDFFAANAGVASNVGREVPIMWAQIVGALLYGAAIAHAISAGGGSTDVMGGLKAGAIVGLLIWGTADFTLFSINQVSNLTATIADVVLETIRGGIAGALVGLVMSKIKA